jgi:hypothetical protein
VLDHRSLPLVTLSDVLIRVAREVAEVDD